MKKFRKILKYLISRKSVQYESSYSMRTDGTTDRQTGMTELIVAFRNFKNAPNKEVGPLSRILLDKLPDKFHLFEESRDFISLISTAHKLSLS